MGEQNDESMVIYNLIIHKCCGNPNQGNTDFDDVAIFSFLYTVRLQSSSVGFYFS